jgi:hypothetical protein
MVRPTRDDKALGKADWACTLSSPLVPPSSARRPSSAVARRRPGTSSSSCSSTSPTSPCPFNAAAVVIAHPSPFAESFGRPAHPCRFMEKPVATGEPYQESIDGAMKIANILTDRGNVVSVGYMLRYLSCVQQMKKIINDNNLTVMATVARYVCAYEAIAKPVRPPAPASVFAFSRLLTPLEHRLPTRLRRIGGPSRSRWAPSSSRAPTSVISRATLAATSTSRPSCASPLPLLLPLAALAPR